MRHIALHAFDQIGNEVVPPLELDIDLTPGVLDRVAGFNQAIVKSNQVNGQHDDESQENK
jgi:hypothetical protein